MLAALLISGCMTTGRKAPETVLSRLRVIAIIPIEGPPLLVHPETEADRAAVAAAGLTSPGSESAGPAYLPLPILCRLCNVVQLSQLSLNLAASSTPRKGDALIIRTEPPPPWMLTAGLARSAAQLLQLPGTRETLVIEGYAMLPIEDRSVNVYMENWYAPLRSWYNADVSLVDYTQHAVPREDAILEVGVLAYEYIGNRLSLLIMVKLIDPATKQVLARAKDFARPKGKSLAEMLQDEGQPMRHLIETTGETLLTQCLQNLGLIPRQTQ
jgi:hypothetical protein